MQHFKDLATTAAVLLHSSPSWMAEYHALYTRFVLMQTTLKEAMQKQTRKHQAERAKLQATIEAMQNVPDEVAATAVELRKLTGDTVKVYTELWLYGHHDETDIATPEWKIWLSALSNTFFGKTLAETKAAAVKAWNKYQANIQAAESETTSPAEEPSPEPLDGNTVPYETDTQDHVCEGQPPL